MNLGKVLILSMPRIIEVRLYYSFLLQVIVNCCANRIVLQTWERYLSCIGHNT